MCGIFGAVIRDKNKYSKKEIQKIIGVLFKLSESRGKEAAGLAVKSSNSIDLLKMPISASGFLRSLLYKRFSTKVFGKNAKDNKENFLAVIGHSRLATHGTENISINNQPVVKDKAICVHDGIIANDKQLWEKFPELKKESELDTEAFLALWQLFFSRTKSIVLATKKVFREIEGSASVAMLFNDNQSLLLVTNTGSLYTCFNVARNVFVFASERYILEEFIDKIRRIDLFEKKAIQQIFSGKAFVADVQSLSKNEFSFLEEDRSNKIPFNFHPEVKFVEYGDAQNRSSSSLSTIINVNYLLPEVKKSMYETWEYLYVNDKLRRCTKCLYPETIPFIDFNQQGICNYCRNYKEIQVRGEEVLEKVVSKYRRQDRRPDCLVTFSGGRDSSYGLHYVKNVLKMNPIAYTYDWGMMTDSGRRNEARVCGKLGVEHIIISADIRKKRRNIRKNVEAWLKRPELGMIPLLMAGDKELMYNAKQLAKKTNIKLIIYCAGDGIEDEPFKVGFCGIPVKSLAPPQRLPMIDKMRLAKYYVSQYIFNPYYANLSLFDTLFAFYSVFAIPIGHLQLFNYIRWDENKVLSTIVNEYNWEKEKNTKTTWRIDDGTAAFYNYIYMTMAGFTENDTFRSNQIREGQMTREKAYELVKEENKPRYESIEWYARIIGFDCNKAIRRINSIPKLYKI